MEEPVSFLSPAHITRVMMFNLCRWSRDSLALDAMHAEWVWVWTKVELWLLVLDQVHCPFLVANLRYFRQWTFIWASLAVFEAAIFLGTLIWTEYLRWRIIHENFALRIVHLNLALCTFKLLLNQTDSFGREVPMVQLHSTLSQVKSNLDGTLRLQLQMRRKIVLAVYLKLWSLLRSN